MGDRRVNRLDKADTVEQPESVKRLSGMGVFSLCCLCERLLERPFAGRRALLSELVGVRLEMAIEERLDRHEAAFLKTKRAEKASGFDWAPGFVVPDEVRPLLVLEARATENDGTAREKIRRVHHLGEIRRRWGVALQPQCQASRQLGGTRRAKDGMILAGIMKDGDWMAAEPMLGLGELSANNKVSMPWYRWSRRLRALARPRIAKT